MICYLVAIKNEFPKHVIEIFWNIRRHYAVLKKKHVLTHDPQIQWGLLCSEIGRPFVLQETVKMVDCAYFDFIVNCGIIFWGNSPHSIKVLRYERIQVELLLDT